MTPNRCYKLEPTMTRRKPITGETVKLTADFLRSTGQLKGGEGHTRWQVVDCECGLCKLGNHVAVNDFYPEDDGTFSPRHFDWHNLQRVGELVADRVPQAGFLKQL